MSSHREPAASPTGEPLSERDSKPVPDSQQGESISEGRSSESVLKDESSESVLRDKSNAGGQSFPESLPEDESFPDLEEELSELLTSSSSTAPPPGKKFTTLPGFLFEGRAADEQVAIEQPTEQEKRKIAWEAFMPQAVAEVTYGTAAEECRRLITQTFQNAFEVFLLPPYATEDDVKRAFRKLSLIIHPDKCKDPDAQEAFLILTRALEEMERPEAREEYQAVIDQARKNVMIARAKENRERKKRGEPKLPTDDASLTGEIKEECKRLVKQVTENLQYAEKTLRANLERELKMEMEKEEEEKQQREMKRRWAQSRDARASHWKYFRDFTSKRRRSSMPPQPPASFAKETRASSSTHKAARNWNVSSARPSTPEET